MKPDTGDEAWVEAVVGLPGVIGGSAQGQISKEPGRPGIGAESKDEATASGNK
jgi:hypothetical protein